MIKENFSKAIKRMNGKWKKERKMNRSIQITIEITQIIVQATLLTLNLWKIAQNKTKAMDIMIILMDIIIA